MSPDERDAVVRRSFERQAGLFTGEDALFARHTSTGPTVAWLEPLGPDMIVLDVACGAAHVAEQAAPSVRQVVGLDLTPTLLALGAERLRQGGVTNVLLQAGDAADLPFLDQSFDLVFCRTALHHFPHPAGPVAEMARVCRPGGRVVVSDMVAPDAQVRQPFDELHRRVDPSHAGVLLEAELADLLRSTVGPLRSVRTLNPISIPLDVMLTDAADRDAVVSILRTELGGGPVTGFAPTVQADQLLVSFTSAVVDAVREPV
jgi:SAM-dependent methyltransferase